MYCLPNVMCRTIRSIYSLPPPPVPSLWLSLRYIRIENKLKLQDNRYMIMKYINFRNVNKCDLILSRTKMCGSSGFGYRDRIR